MKILSFCIVRVIMRKLFVRNYANLPSTNVLRTQFYQIKLLEAFILIIFQCQIFLVPNKNSLEMSEIGKMWTFCGQF